MQLAHLTQQAAQLIEEIEAEHGEDVTLRTAAILLEVEKDDHTKLVFHSNEDRAWAQISYVQEHLHHMERTRDRLEESIDE